MMRGQFSAWLRGTREEHPSGAKACVDAEAFTARLKSCPLKAMGFFADSSALARKPCALTKEKLRGAATVILLSLAAGSGLAQTTVSAASTPAPSTAPAASAPVPNGAPAVVQVATQNKTVRNADRRRAAKLYLAASKLFEKEEFEEAMHGYERAAKLDPGNPDYPLAASVARNHAVTALVQSAAKDRVRGDEAGARASLAHALELDPKSAQANEHLHELGDDALRGVSPPIYERGAETVGEDQRLEPLSKTPSFHLHTDVRSVVQLVFKSYGIEVTLDQSVKNSQVRLDLDDTSFGAAVRAMEMVTKTFYVPLDAHRVLVATDTQENREKFVRHELETVYLSGLTAKELTDVSTLAKTVFNVRHAVTEPTAGTITIDGPEKTLSAFNATMRQLFDGQSQVLLEVRLIQLAHTSARNTGVQLPQTTSAFNVYSEEQSILNANQALVQQIISSGLAAPGDTLTILGILLASGQISSSLFSNGVALFGGGLTASALAPGATTANLNLNSSDSRELDQIQLRLGDNEASTIRSGSRYPIQTSSFSTLGASVPNIPGLTGAGASGSLQSLLASYGTGVPNVPQVEYQDLGLTLKTTPKVLRNDEVALTIDLKIDALAGSSINGNPILNSRSYSGVVTLKQGEGVAVVSELDKSESRAISGTPGISEIPGMNDLTGNDNQKNYASLLIVITPHVVRGTQAAGRSPMMRIEREQHGAN